MPNSFDKDPKKDDKLSRHLNNVRRTSGYVRNSHSAPPINKKHSVSSRKPIQSPSPGAARRRQSTNVYSQNPQNTSRHPEKYYSNTKPNHNHHSSPSPPRIEKGRHQSPHSDHSHRRTKTRSQESFDDDDFNEIVPPRRHHSWNEYENSRHYPPVSNRHYYERNSRTYSDVSLEIAPDDDEDPFYDDENPFTDPNPDPEQAQNNRKWSATETDIDTEKKKKNKSHNDNDHVEIHELNAQPPSPSHIASHDISVFSDPITYTWLNISASYPIKRNWCRRKNSVSPERPILDEVSGIAHSGELLALMGSSGAGKTTLLNILSFRSKIGYRGTVRANGMAVSREFFKSISAYVQQDDIFIPYLTVREHLVFHAMLRLPSKVSYSERQTIVDKTLKDLGLWNCKDSLIGSSTTFKGISGGEKKRLSFATEVLTDPLLLLCDEVTSGLDSFMAKSITTMLKELAVKGKTVICTIHQPSSETFAQFDRVYLMCEGRVAFYGTSADALEFFKAQGYACPSRYNPADFFIRQLAIDPDKFEESIEKTSKIVDAFKKHKNFRYVEQFATEYHERSEAMRALERKLKKGPKYKANIWVQLYWLIWRQLHVIVREKEQLLSQFLQTAIVGVFYGSVYFNTKKDDNGVKDISGLLYVGTSSAIYGASLVVMTTFTKELQVFIREHHIYRTGTYFLSKSVCELPQYSLLATIFVMILYPMTNIGWFFDDVTNHAVAVLILVAHISRSIGYFLACITWDMKLALQGSTPVLQPLMLFCGFFVNADEVFEWLRWIESVSFCFKAMENLMIKQWDNVQNIPINDPYYPIHFMTGKRVLKHFNYHPSRFTENYFWLIVTFFIIQFGAYLCLVFRVWLYDRQGRQQDF